MYGIDATVQLTVYCLLRKLKSPDQNWIQEALDSTFTDFKAHWQRESTIAHKVWTWVIQLKSMFVTTAPVASVWTHQIYRTNLTYSLVGSHRAISTSIHPVEPASMKLPLGSKTWWTR